MLAEGALRNGTPAGLELIETLRWEPGEGPGRGFMRLDRHLARLRESARALGFSDDAEAVRAALDRCASGQQAMRVRLTLDGAGVAKATAVRFEPLAADAMWTLRLAEARLESGDPLIRHKTTRRAAYDAARAEFSREAADEVLLLNERGEICEGTITSLFVDMGDGALLTPALDCGLLDGVLRGEMIDAGRAREAVLTPDDLRAAKAIYIGNSLRGLIAARLA